MSLMYDRVTMPVLPYLSLGCFFFNDTATTEIYTLSLHDALPISATRSRVRSGTGGGGVRGWLGTCSSFSRPGWWEDRKSTRLNSSHANISYAVFCLKKKNKITGGPVHTAAHCLYVLDDSVGGAAA